MPEIITERLQRISHLKYGLHREPPNGRVDVCLLEAVAYVAGEPHSDHPVCVDPVLGAFGRAVNDYMMDEERDALIPIVPKLVGTACGHETSLRRAMLLLDGVIRQILPVAFESIKLPDVAKILRDLKPITDEASASAAESAARSAAESAASAARSAAESAAESAARKPINDMLIEMFNAAIEIKES